VLFGEAGIDNLNAGNGNDSLNGGAGIDQVNGSTGTDKCTPLDAGGSRTSCELALAP